MYPRNAASPERISIGPVVLIADGTVQTSGVTVRVLPFGGSEADGAGTTAYSTDGVVLYTPTQAETNYTSFVLIAKKSACIPASVTVVTSASATAGHAGTDQSKIANATSTVNLSGTTIKTATDIETDTQDIQARLPAALVDGRIVAQAQSVTDKNGYALTQAFPANFSSMVINGGNGHVAVVVHAFQNGVLTAAAIAADALNGKGNWLTTLGANAPAGWINAASITTDAITNDKIAASAVTKISTGVSNLEVLTRLASMIESDGAGKFRFDTIAVSLAVSGGAGGAVNITVEDRSITVT